MAIEKKIYSSWAFKENESEKAHCNREIYKELCEKYKISRYKVENPDDYDIVLTELSQLELALICDDGNLCFGYTMQGSQFYIFED